MVLNEEGVDDMLVIADSLVVASQVRQELDNSLWTFTYSLQYFCQNFGSFCCSLFVSRSGSYFVKRSQNSDRF